VRYQVSRREKTAYSSQNANVSQHLEPERLVPVTKSFTEIANTVTRGKRTEMAKARALYDHVLERMAYDKSGKGWGRGDAQYACDVRKGNCTDFHAYFIALARALDIPARFAIGYTIPPDKTQGTVGGYHCWAEFNASGKWVPVDISEAWKHPELADYYFGRQPANRFEVTVGRDLLLEPSPASGPMNFFVYPLLEVAGKLVPTENEFSFQRQARR
jgi:transglutaminase-like putative cysteine protease